MAPYKALVCIWSTANFSPPWGALRNCSQQGERSAQYAEHGPDREREREGGDRNRHLGRGLLARSRQGIAAASLVTTHASAVSGAIDEGESAGRSKGPRLSEPPDCPGRAPVFLFSTATAAKEDAEGDRGPSRRALAAASVRRNAGATTWHAERCTAPRADAPNVAVPGAHSRHTPRCCLAESPPRGPFNAARRRSQGSHVAQARGGDHLK